MSTSAAVRIAARVYGQLPAYRRADPTAARRFIYLSIASWRPDIPRRDAAAAAVLAVRRRGALKAGNEFDESDHPRAPSGTEEGGQFVSKEGGGGSLHTNREANAARNWDRKTGYGAGFDEQWRDDLKDVLKIAAPEAAAESAAKARADAAHERKLADEQAAEIEKLRAGLAEPGLPISKRYDLINTLNYKIRDQLYRERSIAGLAAKAELADWRRDALRGLAEGKAAKKALKRKVQGEPAFDLPLRTADAQALFADQDPDPAARAQYEAARQAAGRVLGTAPDAPRRDQTEELEKAAAAGELDRLNDWGWVQTAVQHAMRTYSGAIDAEIDKYREAYREWLSPKDWSRPPDGPPPEPPARIRDALDPSDPSKLADGWPGLMVGIGYDDKYTPGQKRAAWRMLAESSPEIARLRDGLDRLEKRANDANRTMFEKAPSFFRGLRMSEVANMLSTGTTGTKIAQNGGNDMLSLTPDASEAFTFTMTDDKTTEQGKHGLAIMVEYDGDAIRKNGGAPVEYSYTAQDGPGRERFGKPITLVHEWQHETRIKKFVPLDKAGLKRFIVGVDRRHEGMTKEAQALIKKMAEHADVLLYDRHRVDYDRYYKIANQETGEARRHRESFGEEGVPVPPDRRKTIADLSALEGAVRILDDPIPPLWRRAAQSSGPGRTAAETLAGWLAKWYYDGDLDAARRAVRRLRVRRLRGLVAAGQWEEAKHPRDDDGRFAETEGRTKTPDELRKRVSKLRTDLRRLRKNAGATPEDEAALAESLAKARRAYTQARGGKVEPENETRFDPPPLPEEAGIVWGTAGALRPVKRGATAAIEVTADRQAAKARRTAASLVDFERLGPSLGTGLPAEKRARLVDALQAEMARYTTYTPDEIASFFEDGGSLLPDDQARLDFLLTLRGTDAYDEAPSRATRTAEDEYGRMLRREAPALVGAAQRVFELAPAFWRATSVRELRSLARTGKWGEGQNPEDRLDFAEEESTAGVATTALPNTALEYLPSDGAVLVEIDAESMRAAHDDLITPKRVLDEFKKPMLAAHMAPLQEARIKVGTPARQIKPAAFHFAGDSANDLTYDQKRRLEKIAPVVVHGASWPESLDPTDAGALKGAVAHGQRSGGGRTGKKRRPVASDDADGIAGLAEGLRERYRSWGLAPRRAELTAILREWRPDLPANEIVRALGGSPGDLRAERERGEIVAAVGRLARMPAASEIMPGLWSVTAGKDGGGNGVSTIVMASSAEEALRAAGSVGARAGSLRGRLQRLRSLRSAWDESKHPRGQPGNPGQFAETEGGGGQGSEGGEDGAEPAEGDEQEGIPAASFKTDTPFLELTTFKMVYISADEVSAEYPVASAAIRDAWNAIPDRLRHTVLGGLILGKIGTSPPEILGTGSPDGTIVMRPEAIERYVQSAPARRSKITARAVAAWTMLHEAGHTAWFMPGLLTDEERAEFAAAVLESPFALTEYAGTYSVQAEVEKLRKALGGRNRDRALAAIAERLAEGTKNYTTPGLFNFVNETWAEAMAAHYGEDVGVDPKEWKAYGRKKEANAAAWKLIRPAFEKIQQRLERDGWVPEPKAWPQRRRPGLRRLRRAAAARHAAAADAAPLNAAARVLLVPALDRERQKYKVDWREKSTRGKKADLFVKTFLIDDTRNRNGWRASWPSIKRLHKTFRGRPGIVFWSCGKKGCLRDHTEEQTYEGNVRKQEKYRVSTIVDTVLDESTHTAYAIHHVEREDFAQQIRQGIVKYLSPSIWPDREKTTVRLADPDGTAGESDLAREWHIDTTGWKGLHDAWVDIPAYGPKARVVATCEGRKDCAASLRAPQAYGVGALAARVKIDPRAPLGSARRL